MPSKYRPRVSKYTRAYQEFIAMLTPEQQLKLVMKEGQLKLLMKKGRLGKS